MALTLRNIGSQVITDASNTQLANTNFNQTFSLASGTPYQTAQYQLNVTGSATTLFPLIGSQLVAGFSITNTDSTYGVTITMGSSSTNNQFVIAPGCSVQFMYAGSAAELTSGGSPSPTTFSSWKAQQLAGATATIDVVCVFSAT